MAAASGAETQAVLDELGNEIERLNKENAALRQRVQMLTHRLFGNWVTNSICCGEWPIAKSVDPIDK